MKKKRKSKSNFQNEYENSEVKVETVEDIIEISKRKNGLFFKHYKKQVQFFMIFTVLSSCIAFIITSLLLHFVYKDTPSVNTGLFSFLLGLIFSSLYLPYHLYKTKKHLFDYLYELKEDNLNSTVRETILKHMEDNINVQLQRLVNLTNTGEVKADYDTQFAFATMFLEITERYFWATSFDKPSEFLIRYKSYLDKINLKFKGKRERIHQISSIPNKARLFIISYDDLIEDIVYYNKNLFELIKMHLDFENDEVICSVRFLLYSEKTDYKKILHNLNIVESDFIFDYFLIDDKIIYGRKNEKLDSTNDVIDISFFCKGSYDCKKGERKIAEYKEVYKSWWEISYNVEALTELLETSINQNENKISSAITNLRRKHVRNEDKIKEIILNEFVKKVRDYYKQTTKTKENKKWYYKYFKDLTGRQLFTEWLNIIKKSNGNAIAIDSTPRKVSNEFFKIWESNNAIHEAYRDIYNASLTCSNNSKGSFKRIFIIEDRFEKSVRLDFVQFLNVAVVINKMKIGIIFQEQIKDKPYQIRYYSDFLIIDSDSSEQGKGFTIRNEQFIAENFSYENLIPPSEFDDYKKIFDDLWDISEKFKNYNDVFNNEKIDKFIK